MVKKSLFARLFGRNSREDERLRRRHGSTDGGVEARTARAPLPEEVEDVERIEVEEAEGEASSFAADDDAQGAPRAESPSPRPAAGEAVRAQEMSPEEEVALRLKEGFQGLNHVLSGIDRKIDEQQRTSREIVVSVRKIPEMMKDVPDASRAGLELLARISAVLENQGKATQELLQSMQGLPEALQRMEEQVEERMRRLEEAGGEASRRVEEVVSEVSRRVEGLASENSERTERLVEELKRQREAQEERVRELVARSGRTTKLVVFLLVVVILTLLLVVQKIAAG